MQKSILVTLALASLMVVYCSALDDQSASSTTPSATYFGVDANDHEAVQKKQHELGMEKFKQLFGEIELEDFDFSPALEESPEKVKKFTSDAHDMMTKAFGILHDLLFQQTSTTPKPDESNN